MTGLMMDYPLSLTHILERAAKLFPNKEIASRTVDGIHRYPYSSFHQRVHLLAHALKRLGIQPGDRVGSLCWNGYRHLELYFAVPCFGAVLHTLNLRLPADQLAYIINHAQDRVIFLDASLAAILEPIRDQILCVEHFIILEDAPVETSLAQVDHDEALLPESGSEPYPWPRLDENAACATCYTSGTTGNPKGVLYSHRALVLHTFGLAMRSEER